MSRFTRPTAKKCAFLAAAAERMELGVTIRNARTEDATSGEIFDVITARACAPLPKLLSYAHKFAGPNSVCLFLKGQNVGSELTEAHKSWKMTVRQHPSLTDPSGVILELAELAFHGPLAQKTPHPGGRQFTKGGVGKTTTAINLGTAPGSHRRAHPGDRHGPARQCLHRTGGGKGVAQAHHL